jgi:hypothetical protein
LPQKIPLLKRVEWGFKSYQGGIEMKKYVWSFAAILAAIFLSFALVGCGGGSTVLPIAITGLTLSPLDSDKLAIDQEITLTAIIEPDDADDPSVTMSSFAKEMMTLI